MDNKNAVPLNPWVTWNGGTFPAFLAADTIIEVKFRDGTTAKGKANEATWNHVNDDGDIIAYRVVAYTMPALWPTDDGEELTH